MLLNAAAPRTEERTHTVQAGFVISHCVKTESALYLVSFSHSVCQKTAARFDDILAHVSFAGTGGKDSRLYSVWDQTQIWDPGD